MRRLFCNLENEETRLIFSPNQSGPELTFERSTSTAPFRTFQVEGKVDKFLLLLPLRKPFWVLVTLNRIISPGRRTIRGGSEAGAFLKK